jgi:hypothetical protein
MNDRDKVPAFGFGTEKIMSIEEVDGYIGEFILATQNSNTVYGILKEVREGYAYFTPSIVQYSDNTLYIERRLPTRIILPLTGIRPIKGSLEEYVKVYNKTLKKNAKSTKK